MSDISTFSFAIITYQKFDGVYDTLDSLFKQDYPRIELIISDDGSDSYYDCIDEIKEYISLKKPSNIENVIYNHSETNQGTVKNINNAIRLSNGAYFKSLGGGDMLAGTDALSKYARFLSEGDYNIVFSKLQGITPEGEIIYHLASCEEDYDLLRSMNSEQLCDKLFARNRLPAPAWAAKMQLFERNGLFPEEIRLIEDYPYWITLCRNKEKIGFIDDVLVRYKADGVSSKGQYGEMFMNDMFIIYNNYVFPYDKRMGFFQPVYNGLKRAGLKAYMSKARWNKYNAGEKARAYILYGPFFFYIWLGNKKTVIKNRREKRKCRL